uniref:Uncharacterized protein n=1 Tax=Anguilla anguilla TaxID=7936 RepID=A0A0E9UTZ1_ANGAN
MGYVLKLQLLIFRLL